MTEFATNTAARERTSFNEDWLFRKGDSAADHEPSKPTHDDSGWRKLSLPHDWGIEGPFDQSYPGETGKLPWWGVGWYRKHFRVPSDDETGRRLFIDFDGAMSHAQVWLNGELLGGWPYGYASFRLELTSHLRFGAENVIAVQLDNPDQSSRWYPGGGIYRNVWLVMTYPVHIGHWGTFVTTPEAGAERATVKVQVRVENRSDKDARVKLRTNFHLSDPEGKAMGSAVAVADDDELTISAGGFAVSEATAKIERPDLWSVGQPHLYLAVTSLVQNGREVDRHETPFGVRTILFTADDGFLLNGRRVQLKGVCMHHDLGPLGAAVNTRAIERQIEMLQEMGCNSIRTSHNPPAPELLDLCDRMGMLVIDEAFDCWKHGKIPHDYNSLFAEWHERDVRAMIRRDRNHPCVILWSTGNEIPEQGLPEDYPLSEALRRIAHEEDPTRQTTAGCNHPEAGFNGFQNTLDVFGYNYKPHLYREFRQHNSKLPIYGSETSSCISSRGEYFFPVEDDKSKGLANFHVSSYDLSAPYWAMAPDVEFAGLDDNPFVAGEYVWTGFDYLGEPTPYNADLTNLLNTTDPAEKARMQKELDALGKIAVPSRSSYFGIIDLAGFKKDRFYLYQARWRPELPMAHILPHWNWPERVGEVTPVHVYTSGDEAELFLNGQSLGRRKKDRLQYRLRWDEVKYEPGELKAVAYKEGKPWAEQTTRTTTAPARLKLAPDRRELVADGRDLCFVTVAVADDAGATVPRTDHRVHFEISGPGELIAVDNGDPTSHESFQAKDRKAFNGLCLAIIRSRAGATGEITLEAHSQGLRPAKLTIFVNT